jgi:hypothetical protein
MPGYYLAAEELFEVKMGGADGGCNPKEIQWADIIVTQRTISADTPVFQMATELDKRVVIENDDLYKRIPTGSHARQFFPSDVVKGVYSAMKHADALTVTTKPLQDEYGQIGPKCFIVPNALDLQIDHNYPAENTDGSITIGYHGSATHSVDFAKLTAKYPGRISIEGWAPLNQFYNAIRRLGAQFMIAPISENAFNAAKSNLKIIEYGLIRTPYIASKFGPYIDFTNKSGGGLLAKNRHKDWKSAFNRMLNIGPEERKAMGERGRAHVEKHFDIRKVVHKWIEVVEHVLSRPANPKRVKLYASKAEATQGDRLAVYQAR